MAVALNTRHTSQQTLSFNTMTAAAETLRMLPQSICPTLLPMLPVNSEYSASRLLGKPNCYVRVLLANAACSTCTLTLAGLTDRGRNYVRKAERRSVGRSVGSVIWLIKMGDGSHLFRWLRRTAKRKSPNSRSHVESVSSWTSCKLHIRFPLYFQNITP